jgi:hypothetical protein
MFLKVVGGPQSIGWYGMGVFEISRFLGAFFQNMVW